MLADYIFYKEEEFVIEAIGLKDIEAVTVGLQGEDEKIFIESVIVKDQEEKIETFECNEYVTFNSLVRNY